MDDTMKAKHTPLVSEENWLSYFQSVHSNAPPNPTQQFICDELREQEERRYVEEVTRQITVVDVFQAVWENSFALSYTKDF